MIYAVFLLGLSFILAFLAHGSIRRLAIRIGAVDRPSGRKQHRGTIPRAGGMTIAVSSGLTFLAGYFLSDWLGFVWQSLLPNSWLFLVALGLILGLGVVDDIVRLRAAPKAFVQLLAAVCVWEAGVEAAFLTNPLSGESVVLGVWSAPVTILWIMAVTNAFNLVDGLDGLAAGLAINALVGFSLIALVRQETMTLYLVAPFLGALLGFLPYNFPKAYSFLGDTGSYLLGFWLAILSLLSHQKAATVVVAYAPLLLVALPVLDVAATMLRRFVSSADQPLRERVHGMFTPDRSHLHYLLVDAGLSGTRVTVVLVGVSLVLSAFGMLSVVLRDRRLVLVMGLLAVLGLLVVLLVGSVLSRTLDQSEQEGGGDA